MQAISILYDSLSSLSISPNTLRLLIIPLFAYAAYLDYRIRRVYNEIWIPVIGIAFIVIGWDTALLFLNNTTTTTSEYFFTFGLSILIAPSIAFTLWQQDILGGADLKALALLAVCFPTEPIISINGVTYPLTDGSTPIFTITILVNALIISSVYRVVLVGENLSRGNIHRLMTRAIDYSTNALSTTHGSIIIPTPSESDVTVDIDTLRMYLRWRGVTLSQLQSNTAFYRETRPVMHNEFTDGAVIPTSKTPLGRSRAHLTEPKNTDTPSIIPKGYVNNTASDAWGADRFITEIDENRVPHTPSPDELRAMLEAVTTQSRVWVSPSIPFFIPLTIGLIIALTYGSLFTGFTEAAATIIVETLIT